MDQRNRQYGMIFRFWVWNQITQKCKIIDTGSVVNNKKKPKKKSYIYIYVSVKWEEEIVLTWVYEITYSNEHKSLNTTLNTQNYMSIEVNIRLNGCQPLITMH